MKIQSEIGQSLIDIALVSVGVEYLADIAQANNLPIDATLESVREVEVPQYTAEVSQEVYCTGLDEQTQWVMTTGWWNDEQIWRDDEYWTDK